MAMKANALAWNPREPMNFVVASEDHNCYSFDMRQLSRALMVHKDHVGAVMDVAWSPTGEALLILIWPMCYPSVDSRVDGYHSLIGRLSFLFV